jgi:hypothetical protein
MTLQVPNPTTDRLKKTKSLAELPDAAFKLLPFKTLACAFFLNFVRANKSVMSRLTCDSISVVGEDRKSRYEEEFEEIERLGRGGYGSGARPH